MVLRIHTVDPTDRTFWIHGPEGLPTFTRPIVVPEPLQAGRPVPGDEPVLGCFGPWIDYGRVYGRPVPAYDLVWLGR